MKRKPVATLSSQPYGRAQYKWHLNQKRLKFDNLHWWEKQSSVDPVAALYEIARRHPLVHDARLGLLRLHHFHPLVFLCLDGLKSWPRLSRRKQALWKSVAGNLKGVDCRADYQKCFSVESEAFSALQIERAFTTKKYQKKPIGVVSDLVGKDMVDNPPTSREMESKIKRLSVDAYRRGYLLLAVAPDLEKENAERLMAATFCQHRSQHQIHKQRALPEHWLFLISEFEDDEVYHGGAKSQVFIRYRRVLDGIRFN